MNEMKFEKWYEPPIVVVVERQIDDLVELRYQVRVRRRRHAHHGRSRSRRALLTALTTAIDHLCVSLVSIILLSTCAGE